MSMGLIAIFIFCLFFTIIFSIFYPLTNVDRVKERNLGLLNVQSPDDVEDDSEEKIKLEGLYKIYDTYYNTKFIQANLRITYGEFKTYVYIILATVAAIFVLTFVLFSQSFAFLISLFMCFLMWLLPDFIINNKKQKRQLAINAQKSDILSIMSSCSATQMPLDKTFKTLSERLKSPAAEIYSEAYQMMAVGNTAEDVLKHLKKVFDSNDFNFLLSSYEVWLENQGSLQDTYRIVSIAVRDKEEIDLHMRGLVAKAKTSFIVVVVMSLFFVLLSFFTISEIFIPFSKSIMGQICIIASFFILFGGMYLINVIKDSVKY